MIDPWLEPRLGHDRVVEDRGHVPIGYPTQCIALCYRGRLRGVTQSRELRVSENSPEPGCRDVDNEA